MHRNAARHSAKHLTRKNTPTARSIARMTTSAANNHNNTNNNTNTNASASASAADAAAAAAAARRRMDMETIKRHMSQPASEEERAWRAPSEGMSSFHDSHKWEFNHAYAHAEDLAGQPLASFLRQCYGLVVHLGNHHRIEEAHIFPLLAHKHPAFAHNAEHEDFHHRIHDGLERYSRFLRESLDDPAKYSAAKLRETLDSFREPLFQHLDKEVDDLRPENLCKHGFTLAEVRRLPF